MDLQTQKDNLFLFKNTRLLQIALVAIILLLGLGVRLLDLSDPPLDFAATRQLHSLILARGYYYAMDVPSVQALPADQRAFGIKAGQAELTVEPPLMEHLTAWAYALFGQENFEIPRVFSALFWVLGELPLYLLVKKYLPINGAMAALIFYELLPFGVIASRSFQPDPLMVLLMLCSLLFQVRWAEQDTWKNALLAALFTGLTVFVKTTAVFFVGIPFVALVLSTGWKQALKNPRVYTMAAISLLPAILFTWLSATVGGNSGNLFGSRFFPQLFSQPSWYQKWFMMAKSVVDYIPLFLAVLGIFLIPKGKFRILYISLWVGYVLFGFTFAYHIYTHNYYHLPLIFMVAIGVGAVFAILMERLHSLHLNVLARLFICAVFLFAAALLVLKSRSELLDANYRYEETYWKNLGDKIGHDKKVVALTHDYGYRLSYWGFISPRLWATQGDQAVDRLSGTAEKPFEDQFSQSTQGYDYFLVTLINDFNSQANLHDYLMDHFTYEQGEGYYLFDLHSAK